MIAVPHKAKQYLLAVAKVLVIAITFGYIFYKLKNNTSLGFREFTTTIFSKGSIAKYSLLFFCFLAAANWFFEILKWQTLVSAFYFQKKVLSPRTRQCGWALPMKW